LQGFATAISAEILSKSTNVAKKQQKFFKKVAKNG
jgi:hypothetical protein